jgi:phosphoribulokinase
MNPVFKILDTVFGSIGDILNSISPSIQRTIRNAFFFLIFVIAMVGAYFGYNKGKGAASIKSDPLAKYTNQVFDIDIKRERDDGKFGDMLETESIN